MPEIRGKHDCLIFSSSAKCQAFLFNLFYCSLEIIVSLNRGITSSNGMYHLSDLTVTLTFILHQNPARDGCLTCI